MAPCPDVPSATFETAHAWYQSDQTDHYHLNFNNRRLEARVVNNFILFTNE